MEDDFNIQLKPLWYDNPCAIHLWGAIAAGIAGAGTSFGLSSLLGRGGGGGGGGQQPAPELDPRGQEFQAELYPTITRGLRGEGLTPELTARSIRELLAATTKGYQEAHRDVSSLVARTIPRADLKVREFIANALNAEYARQKEGIREEFVAQPFEDIGRSQAMAFDALAGERRMGTSIAGLQRESALRRMYQPTFGYALAGGLGKATGALLAGRMEREPSYLANLAGAIGYGRQFSGGQFNRFG